MLGTNFSKNKKSQQGSIMLEVIAVLALMGVMGAMLFRQIYQRNQELHNIQMASEIRTVKEAFSAYIQAFRADLLQKCGTPPVGNLLYCPIDSDTISSNLEDYLPDGWFKDAEPSDFYTFSLWSYKQADASQKQVVYGLIVPTEFTLPQTGWNFKRAARVALLIGADGGVYQSDITRDRIAGSLGTWEISVAGVTDKMGIDAAMITYAAMTGIDVFTPEYELPQGKVAFKKEMNLAMQDAQAWQYFAAGGSSDCYTSIGHTTAVDAGGVSVVENDEIARPGGNCNPLFYVRNEGGISKVFVNNDLEIGSGGVTNLTLTQGGVIFQKDGLIIDKDGRLVSKDTVGGDIGKLDGAERYSLDLANTSVMNDIYLTSRGGVRLSEILPNYILKEVKTISGEETITIPTCPTGYKKALVVLPVSWDQTVALKHGDVDIDEESFPVKVNVNVTGGTIKTTSVIPKNTEWVDAGTGNIKDDITIVATNTETGLTGTGTGTADLRELKAVLTEGVCVKITKGGDNSPTGLKTEDATATGSWTVTLGYKNDEEADCVKDNTIKAIAQSYCVFSPTIFTSEETCHKAGYTWNGNCTDTRSIGAERYQNEPDCRNAGLIWDPTKGRCTNKYSATYIDTSTMSKEQKAATCKAAGYNWNGTNCS